MSEKNEAPRGKPSVIRKKASPTRPSPVSAEMAANLKADEEGFDDGATMISTNMAGLAAPHPNTASSVPTPTPAGDYDPKNMSAPAASKPTPMPTPTPGVAKTLRKSPAIVKASDLASSKVTRPTPAIAGPQPSEKAKANSSSNPTVETPKLVRDELSAKLAAPTPEPPPDQPEVEQPEVQQPEVQSSQGVTPKKSPMRGWIIGAVGIAAIGGVAFFALGLGGSSQERVVTPPAVPVKPVDDSVGNLIKKADEQFVAGNLVGDGGALSLLVAARVASPDDERVALRLGPLADKFQELGQSSLRAGDIASAAAHFKNSLEADPSRHQLANQLEAIKAEMKAAEEKTK